MNEINPEVDQNRGLFSRTDRMVGGVILRCAEVACVAFAAGAASSSETSVFRGAAAGFFATSALVFDNLHRRNANDLAQGNYRVRSGDPS